MTLQDAIAIIIQDSGDIIYNDEHMECKHCHNPSLGPRTIQHHKDCVVTFFRKYYEEHYEPKDQL